MSFVRSFLAVSSLIVLSAPLQAQAPRESAEGKVGGATLKIEYGSPPWNEQRRAQVDRALPVGALWRLGADTRTTMLVDGGTVAIGDAVIEPGGYGLNLRRTGDKTWGFVIFDGSDTTAALEDAQWETPAKLEEKEEGIPERLDVALDGSDERRVLRVRWGPLELTAPVTPIDVKEADLELGGEQATGRWFSHRAGDAPRPAAWTRAGTIGSFFVGDVDCAMEVDVKFDGSKTKVRFSNREREKVAGRLARVERDLENATKQAAGGARFQQNVKALQQAKGALDEELKGLAAAPAPVEIDVTLHPAKDGAGKVGAELVRRDGKLLVVVTTFDQTGESAVDEKKILPAPAEKN